MIDLGSSGFTLCSLLGSGCYVAELIDLAITTCPCVDRACMGIAHFQNYWPYICPHQPHLALHFWFVLVMTEKMFCGREVFIIVLVFVVVGNGATGRYYRSRTTSLATFNAALIGNFEGDRVPLLIKQVNNRV